MKKIKILICSLLISSLVLQSGNIQAKQIITNAQTTILSNTTGASTYATPTPEAAFSFFGGTIRDYDVSIGGPDVVIPETIGGYKVRTIGNFAFSNKGITSVVIPEGVENILQSAFANDNASKPQNLLHGISIPSTVTRIGDSAFYKCGGIGDLIIPDTVTSIGASAFSTAGVTSVQIGSGISEIKNHTFSYNEISNLVIPNTITNIGTSVFAYNNITDITYSDNLTTIPESTFESNLLSEYSVPSQITSIGSRSFYMNKIASLTLPDGALTTINSTAFAKNMLRELQIPNSVTTLGDNAFSGNVLETIELGQQVTTIPKECFSTNNLSSFEIPSTVIQIDENAFTQNHLLKMELPDNVTTLHEFAFGTQKISTYTTLMNGKWSKDISRLYSDFDPIKFTSITSNWGTYDPSLKLVTLDRMLAKDWDIVSYQYRVENNTITSDTALTIRLQQGGNTTDWEYQVIFKDYDGTPIGNPQFVPALQGAIAPTPINHDAQHLSFVRWDKDYSSIYEELIVTAIYETSSYDVCFKDVNGTILSGPKKITYDTTIGMPITPTKLGYVFDAWYKDRELTQPWDFAVDKIQGVTDIYAKWSLNTYQINYRDTKEGSHLNPKDYTIETNDITLKPMPNTDDFIFVGWFDGTQSNAKQITSIAKGSTGELNLYARYTNRNIDVSFQDGNTTVQTSTVKIANAYGDLPTLEKTGYIFNGWYTEPDGKGNHITKETIVTNTANHKLYANWKQVYYEKEKGSVLFEQGQNIHYQFKIEETNITDAMKQQEHLISVYDIYFLLNDERVSIHDNKMVITLHLNEKEKYFDHYKVVYFDQNGNVVEEFDPTVANDYKTLSFETTHLSHYGIVAWNDDKANNDNGDTSEDKRENDKPILDGDDTSNGNPSNGDINTEDTTGTTENTTKVVSDTSTTGVSTAIAKQNTEMYMMILMISLVGLGFTIRKKRSLKNNK